jgi:FKBP-type peptidyl-prolyl cis-trans isomerase
MKNLKVKTDLLFPFVFVGLVIALVAFLLIKNNKKIDTPMITEDRTEETSNIKINNMEEKISKAGDVLVMNYTGRLENGTVFDSNVLPEFNHVQPFEFMLGAGQVIQGWDEGLVGMKIGDKKTLVIPPEKGYGDRAVGNIIPANSTLIFEVELVGIK